MTSYRRVNWKDLGSIMFLKKKKKRKKESKKAGGTRTTIRHVKELLLK